MAVEVDSVIVDLEARIGQYRTDMREAIGLQKTFQDGWKNAPANNNAGQTAEQVKKAAKETAQAEEQATESIKRTRKARVDAVKQSGDAEAAAERETQTRITKAVEDGIAARSAAMRRGSGSGRTDLSREGVARQTAIMSATSLSGTPEVVAEKEINSALVEQTRLQAGLVSARGEDRRLIREQLADMRTFNQLLKTGLTEEEAAVELDSIRVARARELAIQQAAAAKSGASKDLLRFGEGAGLGRSFGSTATVAGIAVAAGVGIGVEAVKSATDYAKALSDVSKQAGLSAEALQVYQHAAVQAGAKSTDFDEGLRQLSENLGRARTGSQEQAKVFAALGVSIKGTASAGELLPTLIERISSISDQSKRARVEVALFGESGAKLDGLLSGGNQKINDLAAALQRTGAILSSADIARLDDVSKKLESVKAQLQVDVAQVVAGNADAIKSLADAFGQLADEAGSAVSAILTFNRTPIGNAASQTTGTVQGFGEKLGRDLVNQARTGSNPSFFEQLGQAQGGPLGAILGRIATSKNTVTGVDYDAQTKQIDALSKGFPSIAQQLSYVQPGKVNSDQIDNLGKTKGSSGSTGKSTDQLQNEADQRTKRFNDLMARYQDEQLAAVAQQTADEEARRQAQRDAIDRDSARQIADLKTQAGIDTRKAPADARLIKARLDQAISAEQAAAQEKKNVINLEGNASAIDRDVAAQNAILEFKNQQLQAQEQLAKTAAERRDLELQILTNEQQIAANSANGVLRKADQGVPTSDAEIAAANRTLANQPADTAAKTAVIDNNTQGPLASYLDKLPRTAKEVNEAFQQAEVQGLQGFNTQLGKTVSGFLKLHGIAGQFIDDIVQIGIKWAEAQLFGQSGGTGTGGILGGSGLGGLLGGLGKLVGLGGSSIGSSGLASIAGGTGDVDSLVGLGGFATGGSGVLGGKPGIDQNILSLNGTPIRKVGRGELLTVTPNGAVNPNQRVSSGGPQYTVIAPQHFDLSNAVMTPDLVSQLTKSNRAYADQVGRAAFAGAVSTSGRQAPGVVSKTQKLKD